LNALEQIPTAMFRGAVLTESTAICHTLAEAFDEPKLWVGRGEPTREEYLFWLLPSARRSRRASSSAR
jgi:glutathione S-transferase